MPYKHITKLIPRKLDARIKLTLEQRKEIEQLYKTGKYTYRELGSKYNVSHKTIMLCADPKRYEQHKIDIMLRRRDGRYYDKDKHREYVKRHRHRKQQLYMEGKLI